MCNTDITVVIKYYTSPDSTVTKTTPYGLVGAGFASWYQFNPNQVFKDPLGRYKTHWVDIRPLAPIPLTLTKQIYCPRQTAQLAEVCSQDNMLKP